MKNTDRYSQTSARLGFESTEVILPDIVAPSELLND